MTTAVSEILQQVEFLSPAEQLELTAKLAERAQRIAPSPHNGSPAFETELPAPSEATADEDWLESLDVFDLKRMPPEDSYVIKVRFVDGGRGQPRRYDFGDLFADKDAGEESP